VFDRWPMYYAEIQLRYLGQLTQRTKLVRSATN
jgi:hypothetical protein